VLLTLLLLLLHAVVLTAVGLPLAALLLGEQSVFEAAPGAFVFLVVLAAADLGIVIGLGLLRWNRLTLAELGWRRPRARDILLGLLGGALAIAAILGVAFLYRGSVAGMLAQVRAFAPEQRALFLLMGIHAALGEETIFRGYLQPTLERKLGRPAGLLITAAVFAVYQLKLRPFPLLSKLATGVVLGGLRQASGSLWPPAIAHACVWVVMGSV
jgi:membrane protease YdiL (CAAX protease family)